MAPRRVTEKVLQYIGEPFSAGSSPFLFRDVVTGFTGHVPIWDRQRVTPETDSLRHRISQIYLEGMLPCSFRASLTYNAAVPGLEVSRGDVLQHELVQAQLSYQTLQLRVLLFQLLQPSRLVTCKPPYSLRYR